MFAVRSLIMLPLFSLLLLLGCPGGTPVDGGATPDAGDGDGDGDGGALNDGGDGDGDGDGGAQGLCDEPAGGTLYEHEVHRFEGSAGEVVMLTRDYKEWGVGESVIYEANRMSVILPDTIDTCVTSADALDYANSHHNWDDAAEATVDDRVYRLKMFFDTSGFDQPYWVDTLEVFDLGGQLVDGPIALTYVGGPRYP